MADIARQADIHPSKVHRYLASLIRAELVEPDLHRGRYRAGPLALSLGLGRLRDNDFVSIATPYLSVLRDDTEETALLSLWADRGPIVLKLEESARPVFLNVRVGSVLPLLRTASGRVFLSYLPDSLTQALVDSEIAMGSHFGMQDVADIKASVRSNGVACVNGSLVSGVNAVAAPVFDFNRSIVGVIGLLGRDIDLDATPESTASRRVMSISSEISQKLGAL